MQVTGNPGAMEETGPGRRVVRHSVVFLLKVSRVPEEDLVG